MIPAALVPTGALDPASAVRAPLREVGGKAAGLARLLETTLTIPPWCVVPASVTADWLALPDPDLDARLAPLLQAWRAAPFVGIAIRSSAPGEDAKSSSRAGQYETEFVRETEQLSAAFRRVATSLPKDAASTAQASVALPVVLQALVDPDCAGVAFSANPVAATPNGILIEMLDGHGAALVSGEATPRAIEHALDEALPDETGDPLTHVIAEALLLAEEALDAAVDLEWCAQGGQLWVLQARPITTLTLSHALLPDEPLSSWFFDQRFPDPISPFSRDTLLPLVAEVALGDALRMRGQQPPSTLLRFHAGRAYTPLRIFNAMLRGAPAWWLSPDLRAIFGANGAPPGGLIATLHYAACAAATVLQNFGDVFFNLRAWERFQAELPGRLDAIPENVGEVAAFEQAWRDCDALTRRYLEIHRWSILWADYAFRLHRFALGVLPASLAARLDAVVMRRVQLPTLAANDALERLNGDATPDEREALLRRFGDRSASLDYATPTWSELHGGPPAQPVAPGPRPWLPSPLAIFVRLLELREEQRFAWEHVLARQRRMLLAIARPTIAAGLLNAEADLWLLTWDEVLQLLRGGTAPAKDVLRLRRHELRVYAVATPAARIDPAHAAALMPAPDSPRHLRGLGASPGRVEGIALLITHPDPAQPPPQGRILVLRALDPGCSAIMRHAAGLVIERGGLLSHAAILAREYGVPMVTDIPGALDLIRDGAPLRLDGTMGSVEVLAPDQG